MEGRRPPDRTVGHVSSFHPRLRTAHGPAGESLPGHQDQRCRCAGNPADDGLWGKDQNVLPQMAAGHGMGDR